MIQEKTTYCRICEVTCGLVATVEDGRVTKLRPDPDHVVSRGYSCPKGLASHEVTHDPDRILYPMKRTQSGWERISWEQAIGEIAAKLNAIRAAHGPDAIALYTGNPAGYAYAHRIYSANWIKALGSRNSYGAGSQDNLADFLAAHFLYGASFRQPVPDVDRAQYLLVVGTNPLVSQGTLVHLVDAKARLRAVTERGGKVVVLDPRRSETAKIASEHHFIRPGTDAAFLLAIVHTLFDEGLVRLGAATSMVNGLDAVESIGKDFAPEAVADFCGIPAGTIRRIAREFSRAKSAACYGRLGTCTQEFGTLSSWAVDLVNVLSGNLDREGGVMFTEAAASRAILSRGKPFQFARWRSRVSGRPECGGQIPSSTMAEEILTAGDGQVRAMVLLMTNPLRSAANSSQLAEAFSRLDFVVAIDFYINETTRYANIILPTPSPAEQSHYEYALYELAVRNVAKWSSAAVPPEPGIPDSCQVLSRLSQHLMGMADKSDAEFDDA